MNKKEQIQAYKIILAVGQIILFISGLILENYVCISIGFFFLGTGTAIAFSVKKEKNITSTTTEINENMTIVENKYENAKSNAVSLKKRFVNWLNT